MISITPAIKSLKIRNLGIIRKADIRFTNGINIVYGSGASGKTTVLNAIRHMLLNEKLIYGPSHGKKRSEKTVIEIELLGKKMSTELKEKVSVYEECLHKRVLPTGERISPFIDRPEKIKHVLSAGDKTLLEIIEAIRTVGKGRAILLEDALGYLDKEHRELAFKTLKESKLQVITTARYEDEWVKDSKVIRLKRLKRFKGFYHGT